MRSFVGTFRETLSAVAAAVGLVALGCAKAAPPRSSSPSAESPTGQDAAPSGSTAGGQAASRFAGSEAADASSDGIDPLEEGATVTLGDDAADLASFVPAVGGVPDSVPTPAGPLVFVVCDAGICDASWRSRLVLAGRVVFPADTPSAVTSVSIVARIVDPVRNEATFVLNGKMDGFACTGVGEVQFMRVRSDGSVSRSKEFGTCTGKIQFSRAANIVLARIYDESQDGIGDSTVKEYRYDLVTGALSREHVSPRPRPK